MEAYWQRALRQRRKRPRLFLWAGLTLIAAGFAALALWIAPGTTVEDELPPAFKDEPDGYMQEGVITEYRDDGSLHFRLTAERISYFKRPSGDFTRLLDVFLEMPSPDAPPWSLKADSGESRSLPSESQPGELEEQITLRGNVTLRQERDDGAYTEVRSAALVVYPLRQFATTDEGVVVVTQASRASAAAFEADLGRGAIKLLASDTQRVTIVVDPNRLER